MTDINRGKGPVSPYLRRPLRSLEDVRRQRLLRLVRRRGVAEAPRTDSADKPSAPPSSKPA